MNEDQPRCLGVRSEEPCLLTVYNLVGTDTQKQRKSKNTLDGVLVSFSVAVIKHSTQGRRSWKQLVALQPCPKAEGHACVLLLRPFCT